MSTIVTASHVSTTRVFTIPNGYYSRSHLRSLGWSEELLRKTPHQEVRTDGNANQCYLYSEADVQAVEKKKSMQKAAKAEARAAGYVSESDMAFRPRQPILAVYVADDVDLYGEWYDDLAFEGPLCDCCYGDVCEEENAREEGRPKAGLAHADRSREAPSEPV